MLSYVMRQCSLGVVEDLCSRYHGYGGAGGTKTYAFAVYEGERVVAAYAWQPPPPGSAKSVCPEAPQSVLSLSRMVAVPRSLRELNHISKPLRRQMRVEIDRGRWPVLVTYHDEGQGHTGHVYKCSGWTATKRSRVPVFEDESGRRVSRYSNGKTLKRDTQRCGFTHIQRWESWACPLGSVRSHMESSGWQRVPVPGKVWKSGNQVYRYMKVNQLRMF